MTVYKGKGIELQVIAMTRDEYLASEYATPGHYPLDDAPGYFVTNGGHFAMWYTKEAFHFLFEAVNDGAHMNFIDAVKATGENKTVRRQDWPNDISMRTHGSRLMTIAIRGNQRILAPYFLTPHDAVAQDWVVVAASDS